MNARGLITIVQGVRLPLGDEKKTQAALEEEFQRRGLLFQRECRLPRVGCPGLVDIPDFVVGRVAIEVKIKGGKREIYRQLERYAAQPSIDEILLVTNVPMGLPEAINGKPAFLANVARAWL